MSQHGLTTSQLEIIRQILKPYAEKIEKAGFFGSRATGRYTPSSDIDLVLYGDLDTKTIDHLWTLFDESSLPFKVDVLAYQLINHKALKQHIDEVMLPINF